MHRWGDIEFPLPFGRVMSPTESFVHALDEKVVIFESVQYFFLLIIFEICINHYTLVIIPDERLSEVHSLEPQRTHMDYGGRWWCQCHLC